MNRRGRLAARPREAVEDGTRGGVGTAQPVEEQADDRVVGDELARAHDLLDLAPQLAAGRDLRPEQVAGGEHRHLETLREQGRLGALPGAGCAQQHHYGHGAT